MNTPLFHGTGNGDMSLLVRVIQPIFVFFLGTQLQQRDFQALHRE